MELFLFILSFISGGVVLAAIYTAKLAFQANEKYDRMEEYIDGFQNDVKKATNRWNSDLRVVSDNHQKIKVKLEEDHYKDLSDVNKKLNLLSIDIETLGKNLNSDREINEGEIKKLYNNIQQTVNMINAVREDQKLNQNY